MERGERLPHLGRGETTEGSHWPTASPILLLKREWQWKLPGKPEAGSSEPSLAQRRSALFRQDVKSNTRPYTRSAC
jgi:hypothetical protein